MWRNRFPDLRLVIYESTNTIIFSCFFLLREMSSEELHASASTVHVQSNTQNMMRHICDSCNLFEHNTTIMKKHDSDFVKCDYRLFSYDSRNGKKEKSVVIRIKINNSKRMQNKILETKNRIDLCKLFCKKLKSFLKFCGHMIQRYKISFAKQ